jgi:hypothetical protein
MPQDENGETSIMKNRWLQLVVGIVGMVVIANLHTGGHFLSGRLTISFIGAKPLSRWHSRCSFWQRRGWYRWKLISSIATGRV